MLGLLTKLPGIIKKGAQFVKGGVASIVQSGKLQAGFTVKGGADTDANKASNSILKTIPVYVWAIAVAVVLGLLVLLGFRRKR